MNKLKIIPNKEKLPFLKQEIVLLSQLFLDNKKTEFIHSFTSLGVYFSKNLSGDKHISYINSKLARITVLVNRKQGHIVLVEQKLAFTMH